MVRPPETLLVAAQFGGDTYAGVDVVAGERIRSPIGLSHEAVCLSVLWSAGSVQVPTWMGATGHQ